MCTAVSRLPAGTAVLAMTEVELLELAVDLEANGAAQARASMRGVHGLPSRLIGARAYARSKAFRSCGLMSEIATKHSPDATHARSE